MFFDLKPLFTAEKESIPVDYQMDSPGIAGISAIHVHGLVESRAGVVTARLTADADYTAPCDRCMAQVKTHLSVPIEQVLVAELSNEEDSDELLQVEDMRLDADELVFTNAVLALPTKYLCSKDCKGLCPKCGINLNQETCSCSTGGTDPRFDVLKQLLN